MVPKVGLSHTCHSPIVTCRYHLGAGLGSFGMRSVPRNAAGTQPLSMLAVCREGVELTSADNLWVWSLMDPPVPSVLHDWAQREQGSAAKASRECMHTCRAWKQAGCACTLWKQTRWKQGSSKPAVMKGCGSVGSCSWAGCSLQ